MSEPRASIIKSNLKHFGQYPEAYVVTPNETIYDKHYLICVDHFSVFYVISDNEQDALDTLIDHFEEQDYQGYFYSEEELEEMTEEERDDLLVAGNHCRYISNDILIIEQL